MKYIYFLSNIIPPPACIRRLRAWYLFSEVITTAFIPSNAAARPEEILERQRKPAPCNGVVKHKSDRGLPHSYLSSY